MIITNRFVMLNFPKTGSSFARKILKDIHKKYQTWPFKLLRMSNLLDTPYMIERFVPMIDEYRTLGMNSQHGTYIQIPQTHKLKKIISITRSPLSRYVSAYLYGWWKEYPLAPVEKISKIFPSFPDLNFEEYWEMLNIFGLEDRLKGITPPIKLGYHTIQFIQFYFYNPDKVLSNINFDYISEQNYRRDMAKVTFLHQENLNQELFDFLLQEGYPEKDITFIKDANRVNETPHELKKKDIIRFYTKDVLEDLLQRDRLLFEIFPEYLNDLIRVRETISKNNCHITADIDG